MKAMMRKKSVILYLGVLLVLVLCVLFPLFMPGFIQTDDGEWMVIRLSSFYQSLADGQFPVRFLGRLNQNYGYPVANFLYPGFLYFGSILHVLKIPFSTSVEIIFSVSVGMAAAGLFFWLGGWFGRFPALVGAGTFLFSPYFLYDLYKRGSVGELLATGVAAVTLLVIERQWRILLPLCIFFLLLSHNTLALLFSAFFVCYIFFKRQFSLLIPFGIGGVMASFFWVPALGERSFVAFNRVAVANPFDFWTISISLAFSSIPFVGAWIYMMIVRKKSFPAETTFFILAFAVAAFFALPVSSLFWKSPLLAQLIQFPYRWYSLWFLTGPWLVAAALSTVANRKKIVVVGALILICAVTSYSQITGATSKLRDEGYFSTNEATTTVADEYMPRWVLEKPEKRAEEKLEFFSGRGAFLQTELSTKSLKTTIKAEEDSVVQINTVFYPGWGAMLDGKPVEVSKDNPRGLMHILIPRGDHVLFMEFRETVPRFMADVASALGFLAYGVFIGIILFRKKGTQSEPLFPFADIWS